MKNKNYLLSLTAVMMAAVVSVGMTSCDDDDDVDNGFVNVEQTSINFDASGKTDKDKITINSNTDWTASVDSSWCKLKSNVGKSGEQIEISVEPNGTKDKRECTISIYAGNKNANIKITQSPGSLVVSPSDVSLLKNSGSTAAVNITTDGKWTADCSADWLNLSSRSGEGRTTITLTALSDNAEADERKATLIVRSGEMSESIVVKQNPKFIKAYANPDINDAVILTNSYAFKMTYEGDVSYFYGALLSKSSSAGWTDEKVISEITSKFNAEKPGEEDEDILYNSGISANTTYILFTVAFNEKGEQGPLQRFEFTTPRKNNNRPGVAYTNVTVWKDQWEWTTAKNAYTKRYYMAVYDDIYALLYASVYPDAAIAYEIRERMKSGNLSPIVDSGTWYCDRTPDTEYFYSACWAQGDDGNFTSEIDKIYVDPSMFSRRMNNFQNHDAEPQQGKISMKEFRKALSQMKVYKK